jgi:hypothetical protein
MSSMYRGMAPSGLLFAAAIARPRLNRRTAVGDFDNGVRDHRLSSPSPRADGTAGRG